MIFITLPDPSPAVHVILVVPRRTVCTSSTKPKLRNLARESGKRTGKEFPSTNDIGQLVNGFSFGVSFASVEITGEDAGVTVTSEEDKRVGEGLEPGCYGRLESSAEVPTRVSDENGRREEREGAYCPTW